MYQTNTQHIRVWLLLLLFPLALLSPIRSWAQCACRNVNVSLQSNCAVLLTPDMVSNCTTGSVRVVDDNPLNGGVIDCPGTYMYGVFDISGTLVCMGTVVAEDKAGPIVVDYLLACTGAVTPIYDNFKTATFLNTDIQEVYNQEQSWQNPSYLYFSGVPEFIDGCNTTPYCNCQTQIKSTDQISYLTCTDPDYINNQIYARLNRTFTASDCMGNKTTVTQEILFKSPLLNPDILTPVQTGFENKTIILNGSDCGLTVEEMIAQFKAGTYPATVGGVAQPFLIFDDPFHCDASETYGLFPEAVTSGLVSKLLNSKLSFSIQIIGQNPDCLGGRTISTKIQALDWCNGTVTLLADNLTLKLGNDTQPSRLSAATTSITADAAGGIIPLDISANTAWLITQNMYWLSVSPSTGTNNGRALLTVAPNTSPLARSGILYVSGAGVSTLLISITQSGTPAQTFTLTPATLSFSGSGGASVLSVKAPFEAWTLQASETWVELDKTSGSGNAQILVTCGANPTLNTRTALLTLQRGGQILQTTVTQQAGSAMLILSPLSIAFEGQGGKQTLQLQSNSTWILRQKPSWVSVNLGTGLQNATLEITCAANTSGQLRTGTLTFGTDATMTRTVQISQVSIPNGITVSPTTFNVPAEIGIGSLQVRASGRWSIETSAPWISVNGASTGSGDSTLAFSIQKNPNALYRNANILVRGADGSTASANVTQAGSLAYLIPDSDSLHFNTTGGVQTLHIESNTFWTLSEFIPWIKLSLQRGQNDQTVELECLPNTTTQARSASLRLAGSGTSPRTIRVFQSGFQPSLVVSPVQLTFEGSGGSSSLAVTANAPFTATSQSTWLRVQPDSVHTGQVNVACIPQLDTLSRQGTITVSTPGIPAVSVSVYQSAPSLAFLATVDTLFFSAAAGIQEIGLWSNSSWIATTSTTWIQLPDTSGIGSKQLKVQCALNPGASVRKGKVLVRNPQGVQRDLVIVQAGNAPTLSATPTAFTLPAKGGSIAVVIRSNQNWTMSKTANWVSLPVSQGVGDQEVVIAVTENTQATSRFDTLRIMALGVDTLLIPVFQSGNGPFLSVNPTTVTAGPEGGVLSLPVYSNTTWRVSELLSWVQVTPTVGSLSDTLKLTFLPRASNTPRSGVVTIYGPGVPSVRVIVQQNGVSINTPAGIHSGISASPSIGESSPFRAYPNPGSDRIYLDFPYTLAEPFTLVVRDMQGRILTSRAYPSGAPAGTTESFALHQFPEGLYTITLAGSKVHHVEKIQVRR